MKCILSAIFPSFSPSSDVQWSNKSCTLRNVERIVLIRPKHKVFPISFARNFEVPLKTSISHNRSEWNDDDDALTLCE